MLTYPRAQMEYRGRKNKHIGRKIKNRVYMTYDSDRDCFVLSELMTKYEAVPDPNYAGATVYVKAPEERWKLHPFAEVHTDHVLITRLMGSSTLEALFGLSHYANRSKKLSGRRWLYIGPNTREEIIGDPPITIRDNTLSCAAPPKVRVTDAKKRNEMNRMIQSIRNLIKVRTKLGAFDSLTPAQVDEYIRQTIGVNKWQVFNNSAKFLELLNAVNPEDLKSFYPLLWLADKNWYYWGSRSSYGPVDWVTRFNHLVDRMREKMRRELGVVEYVESTE